MLNVGERNIIYIGSLLQLPSGIKRDYIKNDCTLLTYTSITDFLVDFHLSSHEGRIEVSLIYIEFIDWDMDIRSILNTFKTREETKFILFFENESELSAHKMELNRVDAYTVIKSFNFETAIYQINSELKILDRSEELLSINDISIKTDVQFPVYIDAISSEELIIKRPSFSQEIEEQDFKINFDTLNLEVSSKQKITYSDNMITVSGDFNEAVEQIKSLGGRSTPYIKTAIFSNNNEITKDLYEISNLSIMEFKSCTHIDLEYVNSSQIIIINERYIDNNPLSREILSKITLESQYVIIFEAKSSSKAYQKAYDYRNIILYKNLFSLESFNDLTTIFRKKIESKHIIYDEWDSSSSGKMSIKGLITSFTENSFNLNLPFKLKDSSILTTGFWREINSITLISEAISGSYSHKLLFVDADELDTKKIRILLNQLIYAKDNKISTFTPTSLNDSRHVSLKELEDETPN